MHNESIQQALSFKKMTLADLVEIEPIEKLCYPNPWSRKVMADCIKAHYQCVAMRYGEELVGYAFMLIGVNESHLLNLSVAPEQQRKGYAERLLQHMAYISRYWHCKKMLLEVRISNLPAIRLYEKAGFEYIGRRKNYYRYDGIQEDALVMEWVFSFPNQ